MGDKNGAQAVDVEELSKRLGKLTAQTMNFATVTGYWQFSVFRMSEPC